MVRLARGRVRGSAVVARVLVCLGVLLGVGGVATRVSAATNPWPYYWLTPLGHLPGYSSTLPVALNQAGVVLCQASGANLPTRSFLWSPDNQIDLGALSGGDTRAYDLDDEGHVVGADISPEGVSSPVRWEAGQAEVLPLLPGYVGGEARALDNDGRIAGDLIDAHGGHHACLWEHDAVSLLPDAPGRPFSHAQGMNNLGQVVGSTYAVYDPPTPGHAGQGRAALWRDGEVIDLGVTPGYSASEANAINDAGDVVGNSRESPGYSEAFRWRAGEFRRIRTRNSTLAAINNPGRVVGTGMEFVEYGNYRSMAWWWSSEDLGAPFLNTIANSGYDYSLRAATAINDAGQITVTSGSEASLLTRVNANVQLSLTASTYSPQVGVPFTLTLKIQNLGPDPAYDLSYSLDAPAGLEYLRSSATAGSSWERGGMAGGFLSTFPPDTVATVTLTAVAHAAGDLLVRATKRLSNDAALDAGEAKVALLVAGTPLPDLEASWSRVRVQRPPGRPRSEWSVAGTLQVTNWGTSPTPRPRVHFYLVMPGELLARKRLLQTRRLDTIEPGESKLAALRARLPLEQGPLHGRVLAVLDEPDQISESIETNNHALSSDLAEERK